MIVLEPTSPYFSQSEMEANYDPPQCRELEKWEVTLSILKKAILLQDISKARKTMYALEGEIFKSKIDSFNDGYEKGSLPLPF